MVVFIFSKGLGRYSQSLTIVFTNIVNQKDLLSLELKKKS